jgi:DNA-directed RNA polymerase subunit RPC12/RpoP
MAIVFHCEYCGKEIKAADTAGGKWGKCPNCHNRVYVPTLETEEELKLAPIDNGEQEREKQLMAETYKLTQDILREREVPEGAEPQPAGAMYEMSDKELMANIIKYFQQMSYGDLDEADRTAALISPFKTKANEIIDQLALNDPPEPELAQINPQVLVGLIKTLRLKIGK